ncbi:MAG: nuclear transport factor 2 family protein [Halioglobus sp.]
MTLEDLLAEREIYRNLVSFARAMDDRDWKAIDELAIDDLTASFGMGEIQGRSQVVAFIQSFLDNCGPTQHLLGNVIIDVSGNTARSTAYVSDMHVGQGDKSELTFRTLGRYSDQWVKVDGAWLMSHRVKDNGATIGSMDVFGP